MICKNCSRDLAKSFTKAETLYWIGSAPDHKCPTCKVIV